MKVTIKYAIIFLLIIAAIVAGYLLLSENKEEEIKIKTEDVDYGKLDEVVFEVQTAKVKKGNLIKTISANGTIKADKEIKMIANTTGYLKTINIFDGKKVKKGDILLQFDDREAEMELEEKYANLIKANADFAVEIKNEMMIDSSKQKEPKDIAEERKELKELLTSGKITEEKYTLKNEMLNYIGILSGSDKIDVIKSRTGLNNAKVSLERAKLQLAYTKVTAPFNGVVGNFNLSAGERITSGTELCRLFDIEKLKLEVGVLENEISGINAGNPVKVKLNSLPGKTYKGKVLSISPYISPETKTCRVIINLNNTDMKIKPGMSASVAIETDVLKDKLLIPKEALLVRDKRTLVFTVEENLAKWKYITVGDYNDEYYIVTKGLEVGEEVITKGQYTLAHDANVKVIN